MYKLEYKKLILKIIFVVIIFLIINIIFTHKASAQSLTLSPSSGSIGIGLNQNVQIIATSATAFNAATIKMSLTTAGTITAFTPTSGLLALAPSGCSSPYFTSSTICVSVAKSSGSFTAGEVLGTFTIQGTSAGTATASFTSGSEFASPTTAYTGTGGSFTISSGGGGTPPSTLPNTATGVSNILYLGFGIILISASIGSMYYIDKFNYKNSVDREMVRKVDSD